MTHVELTRELKTRSFFLPTTEAVEIAEALFHLGGSAHRTLVIEWIARRRGEPASEKLQARMQAGFERAIAEPSARRIALMHLPMGPGSHRWGLTAAGYGTLMGLLMPKLEPAYGERRAQPRMATMIPPPAPIAARG